MSFRFATLSLTIAAISGVASAANAAAIAIPNGNFESTTATATGVGQINDNGPSVPSWAILGGASAQGALDITDSSGGGSTFYGYAAFATDHGKYIGFAQGKTSTYGNLTGATFSANTTYTLTAEVGNSYSGDTPGGSFNLIISDGTSTSTALVSLSGTPTPVGTTTPNNSYLNQNVKYYFVTFDTATNASIVGKPIEIAYQTGADSSGGTQSFDNFTLDGTTNTPEPASLAALGLVAGGLLRRRRSM